MLSNLLGHQSKSWTFSSWTVVLHRRSISMFTKGNPRHDNYNPWGRALISSPSQLRTCFHFFSPNWNMCPGGSSVSSKYQLCRRIWSTFNRKVSQQIASRWSLKCCGKFRSFNAWRKRHITAERLKLPIAMRGHLAEHWWGRRNNIGKRIEKGSREIQVVVKL